MNRLNWLIILKVLRGAAEDRFRNVFGLDLGSYWSDVTGFELVAFDKNVLKTADGSSCRDVVMERYGEQGVDIIEKLIESRRLDEADLKAALKYLPAHFLDTYRKHRMQSYAPIRERL